MSDEKRVSPVVDIFERLEKKAGIRELEKIEDAAEQRGDQDAVTDAFLAKLSIQMELEAQNPAYRKKNAQESGERLGAWVDSMLDSGRKNLDETK